MKYLSFFLLILISASVYAQDSGKYEQNIKVYEPSDEHPFGRLNPAAPPETEEFSFMIGICDCIDSIRSADGSWISFPSIWQGKYFLNGFGIQDNYFNPRNPTSNIRLYDPVSKTWKVTYFQNAQSYFSGTWEGRKHKDKIVLERKQTSDAGEKIISRLSFYNMSHEGFDWISESISPDGKSSAGWIQHCRKRK